MGPASLQAERSRAHGALCAGPGHGRGNVVNRIVDNPVSGSRLSPDRGRRRCAATWHRPSGSWRERTRRDQGPAPGRRTAARAAPRWWVRNPVQQGLFSHDNRHGADRGAAGMSGVIVAGAPRADARDAEARAALPEGRPGLDRYGLREDEAALGMRHTSYDGHVREAGARPGTGGGAVPPDAGRHVEGRLLPGRRPAAGRGRPGRPAPADHGQPRPRQIDGLGGTHPLTSKVAVVSVPDDPDVDVDYLFLQVAVDAAEVSGRQSCGNLLAGIGPFAVERGPKNESRPDPLSGSGLDLVFQLSGWRDLNPRPLRPERSALPSCATPRCPPVVPATPITLAHRRPEAKSGFVRGRGLSRGA